MTRSSSEELMVPMISFASITFISFVFTAGGSCGAGWAAPSRWFGVMLAHEPAEEAKQPPASPRRA
jgi:hypothetical protein